MEILPISPTFMNKTWTPTLYRSPWKKHKLRDLVLMSVYQLLYGLTETRAKNEKGMKSLRKLF